MQTFDALNSLEDTVSKMYGFSSKYDTFLSKQTDTAINGITKNVKNNFSVDYTKRLDMTSKEMKQLQLLIIDFLKNKKDNFNSHYIQLLAWHIDDVKIFKQKTKFGERTVSFLEYAPNPLLPFTYTQKIFQIFSEPHIACEKVSMALLINYLNNYVKASTRFKTMLRRYLKSIKYAKDVDVYFNTVKVRQQLRNKKATSEVVDEKKFFKNHLETLGVNPILFTTDYFKDLLHGAENGL